MRAGRGSTGTPKLPVWRQSETGAAQSCRAAAARNAIQPTREARTPDLRVRRRASRRGRRFSEWAFAIGARRGDQRLRALCVSVLAHHSVIGALGHVPRPIEMAQVVADLRFAVVEVPEHHVLFVQHKVVFGVLPYIAQQETAAGRDAEAAL